MKSSFITKSEQWGRCVYLVILDVMLYLCFHKVYLFVVVVVLIIIGLKCQLFFSYKEHLNQCLLNCVYDMRILNKHGFTLYTKFNDVYMWYKPLA